MRRMKKNTSVIITGIILLIYTLAIFLPVYAESIKELESKLNEFNRNKNETQRQLEVVKEKKEDAIQEKQRIDQQIAQTEKELEQIDKLLKESEQLIKKSEAKLADATEKMEQQYELLKLRARIMYEDGDTTYLEILLNSKSLFDFLSRVEIIKDIIKYDTLLLENLKQNKQIILEEKQRAEDEKANRQRIKDQITSKRRELRNAEISRQKIIQRLTSEEQEYAKALAELENASKSIEQDIKRLQQQSNRKYTGGTFEWPTPSCYTITSPYGNRFHPVLRQHKLHTGIDIGAKAGADVIAANDGQVILAGWNNAYGQYIIIDHGGGISTLYAHNSSLLVKAGQEVKKGQVIAKVGNTGYSTGPHLHFEIRINGSPVNPMTYFK